jgi:hypothetical protein
MLAQLSEREIRQRVIFSFNYTKNGMTIFDNPTFKPEFKEITNFNELFTIPANEFYKIANTLLAVKLIKRNLPELHIFKHYEGDYYIRCSVIDLDWHKEVKELETNLLKLENEDINNMHSIHDKYQKLTDCHKWSIYKLNEFIDFHNSK